MIHDLDIGGVLIPGLLVLAVVALIGTIAVIRLFTLAGVTRAFAYRPLVELATFAILYGLLVQSLPAIGLIP
jgi:hypothetical protein